MNRKRLNKVADFLEKENPTHFDMASGCDCIGACAYRVKNGYYPDRRWSNTKEVAKKFLGLTEDEVEKLFLPNFIHHYDEKRSSKAKDVSLAVRVLRRAARLGKIIWR